MGECSGFMGSDRNTVSSSLFTGSAHIALLGRVKSLSQLSLGGVHGTGLDQRGRKEERRKERSLQPKHTTNYKGKLKTHTHTHLTIWSFGHLKGKHILKLKAKDFGAVMYLADGGQCQRSLCKHQIDPSFPAIFPDGREVEKLRNCRPLGWVWVQHHL